MKYCGSCGEEKPLELFSKNQSACKSCKKSQYADWLQRNRDYHKKWCTDNPEKVKEKQRKWLSSNKDRKAYLESNRRARKLQATPAWANEELIRREYELASWCSKVTGERYTVDHIIPLMGKLVCGLHVHNNLQVLRAADNSKKSNHFEV